MINISIEAEKIMYGYTAININYDNSKCLVSWKSIADGGIIANDASKEFNNIDVKGLLSEIKKVTLPNEEIKDAQFSWNLYVEEDGNNIISLQTGYWNDAAIIDIVQAIDVVLKDDVVLEDIKGLIDI